MRNHLQLLFMSVALLTSFLVSTGVSAAPSRPLIYCSGQCNATGYWNGTTYGGATQVTISNPGLQNTNSYWERYLQLDESGSGPYIKAGVIKGKGNAFGATCGDAHTVQYFAVSYDVNKQIINWDCFTAPSSDYNADVYISIVSATDCLGEGDGLRDEMYVRFFSTHKDTGNICLDTEAGFYTRMEYKEDIADTIMGTAHEVWGSHWLFGQWVDSNNNFHYQSRGMDYGPVANNPPLMYWNVVPASGNSGGNMYSCDYGTPNNGVCTYGG